MPQTEVHVVDSTPARVRASDTMFAEILQAGASESALTQAALRSVVARLTCPLPETERKILRHTVVFLLRELETTRR